MKVLAILCTLLVASSASPAKYGNSIDNLIKAALEYIRYEMQQHEPIEVPQIPEQIINDPDTQIILNATLNNVYVSDASSFQVRHIENNLDEFWAKFDVFLPSGHAYGDYILSGSAVGKDVEGQGTFAASITNLDVQGFLQMELVDHYVQIQSMNLTYTIDNLPFTITGLSVQGMTEQQVDDILNTQMLAWLKDNEALACEKISRQIMIEGNQMMYGKTLLEIIDWLKNFVKTTAAPSFE